VQERVNGTVRVKLFKGAFTVVGRRLPSTLDAGARELEPGLQAAFSSRN
jgi:argininosuccinate synthase